MIRTLQCTTLACLLAAGQLHALTQAPDPAQSAIAPDDLVAGVEAYLDPADNPAWEILSELTPAEWAVLRHMLNVPPDEFEGFVDKYSESDRIYVLPDGSLSDLAPDEGSGDWQYIKVVSLRSVIDQIRSIVSTINNRAANIQGRLPTNTPAIRDLFTQLSPQALRDLLVLVQDTLGPTLDLVAAQRDGFDDFRNSGVFAFRSDLNLMLDNLMLLWDSSQQLVCLTRPAYQPIPLRFARLRTLIDRAPPILLYGLYVALEQIEFDWQLSDLTAEFAVDPFCDSANAASFDVSFSGFRAASIAAPNLRQNFEIRRCNFLRDSTFFVPRAELAAAQVVAEGLGTAAEYTEQLEKAQKDDQVVQATGVALGGGGAGVNFKNPLKVVAAITSFVLSQANKILDRALAVQESCEAADAQREADLLSCRAQVKYVLPEGDIVYLDELVDRRISEVQAALPDLQDADTARDMARAESDPRQAFVCMCDAYQRLVLPADELPRVNCVEDPDAGGNSGKP